MFVKAVKLLIRLYQGLSVNLKPRCRFYPSCSNYALQAVSEHGAIAGLVLAIKRFFRCNPFSSGGIDLVPQKTLTKENKL